MTAAPVPHTISRSFVAPNAVGGMVPPDDPGEM